MIIEVKGKTLRFDTLGVRQFLSKVDFDNFGLTANYAMCWGGLYSYCYSKGLPRLSFEEVMEWVDSLTQEEVDKISLAMAEVEAYKKLLPAETEVLTDEEKKSQSVST